MSLFKICEWWSERVENAEFDLCCLAVGNITNENPAMNKVIIGCTTGSLRIYSPSQTIDEDGVSAPGSHPDHLLLEAKLESPILQLAIGKFVSGTDSLHLCVLHPANISIFSVTVTVGQTEHGSQPRLQKEFQHGMQRRAFSMVTGNFGSVKGRDYIAVQSLDGCLSIFEQESLGFVCFLPGFLLPGPLAYLPRSDTLVTQTSDWILQSYKFQTLASLVQEKRGGSNSVSISSGKRMQPEWTQIMEESAIDIKILIEPGNVSSIILLTTHSFLGLKDSGVVKFIKKLEYNPSCFTAYHNAKTIFVCVATHTQSLLIYKESELKWATQLTFVPVAIERADFQGIRAGLVFLSDDGRILIGYLGTDPSLFVAPPTETREINYEETDKELAQLHKIIRGSTKDTSSLLSVNRPNRDLSLFVSLGEKIESWPGPVRVSDPDGIPSITLFIRVTAIQPLNAVRLTVIVEKPFDVLQNTFVLRSLSGTSQIVTKVYLSEPYVPSSLNVLVNASFTSSMGAPFVLTKEVMLPLQLAMKASTPNKEADYKVTIATNKPTVDLGELFADFISDEKSGSAIGLQYIGGSNVTILSSRTTNRYRLQSDRLSSIWIVLHFFLKRLERFWASVSQDDDKLEISVTTPLPTKELFVEIDDHYSKRKKHKELEAQLVQRAAQFRAVQRRLITKFKDKTPTPLTNLDNLLEGTYKQILQITEAINNNMKLLDEAHCQLRSVLRLLLELLLIQSPMDAKREDKLRGAFATLVPTGMDQGWEEVGDCGISFILKSIHGKTLVNNVMENVSSAQLPQDVNKLKKHIATLIDKLLKGGMLDLDEDTSTEGVDMDEKQDELSLYSPRRSPTPAEHISQTTTANEVPMGSKLGEDRARSARIRSARIPLAKVLDNPIIKEESSESDEADGPAKEDLGENKEDNEENKEDSEGNKEDSEENNEDSVDNKEDNEKNEGTPQAVEQNFDNALEDGVNENIFSPKEDESLEKLKKSTLKENLIEAPKDIFDNPIDEDIW